MQGTIFDQIIKEKDDFEDGQIQIVSGLSFNQKDIVRRIHLYYHDTFETGEKDSEGWKKHFYNLTKFRCKVASKAIDLDTKDIRLRPENEASRLGTWLLSKELKFWMKEKGFGKTLNQITKNLPIFGTVVIKAVDDQVKLVDLRNFYLDAGAEDLDKARYIIEKHFYTPDELKKKKWDNIEEVISKWREEESEDQIEIFERYGEVRESWLKDNGDPEKYIKAVFIVAYPEEKEGIILYKSKIDKLPYKEVHWDKTEGRWLGIGIVEELFDNQIRVNELINLKGKGLYWTAKLLFQTRDPLIGRSILTEADFGDILKVQSEINPIDIRTRDLSAFVQEESRWDVLSDQKTFAYDVIRGERMPAGTPLGSAILQSQMAGGFFDLQRENVGLFLKELLYDLIIPTFKKKNRAEHIMQFYGNEEEMEKIDRMIVNGRVSASLKEYIQRNNFLPTLEEVEMIKTAERTRLREREERVLTIPDSYYENLKYKIDIIITGERVNTAAEMASLQQILAIIGTNPTILQDPTTKKIFYKLLDSAGINIEEFRSTEEIPTVREYVAERGGGIAAPKIASPTPIRMPAELTI
ncbi:MAG: hypothetical protein AB1414_01130 [bacterium]